MGRFLYSQRLFQRLLSRRQSICLGPSVCISLSRCPGKNRPPGGGRPLSDPAHVYKYNNWDNVVWDEEQEEEAKKITEGQRASLVPEDQQAKYEENADEYWNDFYGQHQNRFFKDRHWLFTEFPELAPEYKDSARTASESGTICVASTGANTVETVSQEFNSETKTSDLKSDSGVTETSTGCIDAGDSQGTETNSLLDSELRTCKSSSESQTDNGGGEHSNRLKGEPVIDEEFPGESASFRFLEVGCGVGNTVFPVLQTNNNPRLMVYCCDFSSTAIDIVKEHPDYSPQRCHAFVCDISSESSPVPFPENSLDAITLIFVLSAINPDRMEYVVNRLASYLKPGGVLLFRDYGRYDMAQLRFKKGRCLSENFYVRGDGTRVYFFTQDELRDMFTKAGLEEKQNYIDRRLQVNRGRQLKMYRVWIQCKYVKPNRTAQDTES